jgi:hypothetical protein
MKLNIFTIVLDGSPWIGAQFAELLRLRDVDWHWSIVEGASKPHKDTAWMSNQLGRVSHDGTHQFLQSLNYHPRITVNSKSEWGGKNEMINAALTAFAEDGVLLQMDSDELWTAYQLAHLRRIFMHNPECNTVKVKMDYMLGPNVISTSKDGYGNRANEWVRAWRYSVGLWMECHEPPIFNGNRGGVLERDESEQLLGRILHMAWVTPQQVYQKQCIYKGGYDNACLDWQRLQQNKDWPVKELKEFLPWVGKNASADLLFKHP